MPIEIEKTAVVDRDMFSRIQSRLLELGAEDLGENNTQTVFFHPKDYRVKVQKNLSKKTAKITWKSGASLAAVNARREIELPFKIIDFETAVDLVQAFLPGVEYFPCSTQKRHDYRLDDVDIAVKWSEDFGYHIEFDITTETTRDRCAAEKRISALAERLGIHILSEEEENAFLANMAKARRAKEKKNG